MMRFAKRLVLGAVFASVAGPVLADAFDDCAANRVGQGACTPERLGEALSLLSPGSFVPFRDAGMESFAMAFSMNELSEGVARRLAGGTCEENLELQYSVDEIWFAYVRLPDGASDALQQEFGRFERLRDHAMEFALAGGC